MEVECGGKKEDQLRTIESNDALQNTKYNINMKLQVSFAHGVGMELRFCKLFIWLNVTSPCMCIVQLTWCKFIYLIVCNCTQQIHTHEHTKSSLCLHHSPTQISAKTKPNQTVICDTQVFEWVFSLVHSRIYNILGFRRIINNPISSVLSVVFTTSLLPMLLPLLLVLVFRWLLFHITHWRTNQNE